MTTSYLKTFFALLLSAVWTIPTYSCSCIEFSFCSYFEEIADNETALIFKGSWLQEVPTVGVWGSSVVQYKVEQIYQGEIVTENSIHFAGETYVSTDSTVWVVSGSDASCLRYFNESTSIFTVFHNPFNEAAGYVPSICSPDYFPIDDDDQIHGHFFDFGEVFTLSLTEFENLVKNGCFTSSTTETNSKKDQIIVYPNPVSDMLNIEVNFDCSALQMALYDTRGVLVKQINGTEVPMDDLIAGVYILRSFCDNNVVTKKVIKI